jgi:hydrogenase maturation protease
LVVFAVGNPSRGDDALGPVLLARLEAWLAENQVAAEVELIEDFQLQIEHALDLQGRDLALFIDAGTGSSKAPFCFTPTPLVERIGHATHALEPGSVLQVFREMEGQSAPPAFTLCVAGASFELGAALSEAAQAHVEQAFDFVCELLSHPHADVWALRAAQS